MLEGKVGYILVGAFGEDAPAAVAKAVDQFNQQGMNAVILDLRNSGGGYISTGLDIAACFAPTGAPYLDIVGRTGVKSFAVKHGTSVKPIGCIAQSKNSGSKRGPGCCPARLGWRFLSRPGLRRQGFGGRAGLQAFERRLNHASLRPLSHSVRALPGFPRCPTGP
jgi:hypothetical protein